MSWVMPTILSWFPHALDMRGKFGTVRFRQVIRVCDDEDVFDCRRGFPLRRMITVCAVVSVEAIELYIFAVDVELTCATCRKEVSADICGIFSWFDMWIRVEKRLFGDTGLPCRFHMVEIYAGIQVCIEFSVVIEEVITQTEHGFWGFKKLIGDVECFCEFNFVGRQVLSLQPVVKLLAFEGNFHD